MGAGKTRRSRGRRRSRPLLVAAARGRSRSRLPPLEAAVKSPPTLRRRSTGLASAAAPPALRPPPRSAGLAKTDDEEPVSLPIVAGARRSPAAAPARIELRRGLLYFAHRRPPGLALRRNAAEVRRAAPPSSQPATASLPSFSAAAASSSATGGAHCQRAAFPRRPTGTRAARVRLGCRPGAGGARRAWGGRRHARRGKEAGRGGGRSNRSPEGLQSASHHGAKDINAGEVHNWHRQQYECAYLILIQPLIPTCQLTSPSISFALPWMMLPKSLQ